MSERRRKAELRLRLSPREPRLPGTLAATRHLTAVKIIDLPLIRLRETEASEDPVETGGLSHAVSAEARAKFDRLADECRSAVRYLSSLSQMVTAIKPATQEEQHMPGLTAVYLPSESSSRLIPRVSP